MKKILIANWKMNLTRQATVALAKKIKLAKIKKTEIVLSPSFPYLDDARKVLRSGTVKLAAQNVASWDAGAFTGEVSAAMIKEAGCAYAIVGHSERRQNLFETDQLINQKISQLLKKKITPILCVGETLAQKNAKQTGQVIMQQLKNCLSKISGLERQNLIVAYEPVWAIGAGKVVDLLALAEVCRAVKRALSMLVADNYFDEKVRFIYGGSIDAETVKGFFEVENLAGFLVGGASLKADSFLTIAREFSAHA